MPLLISFIVGALIGWNRAHKLGGNTADKLQYGFVTGIILVLLMLVVSTIVGWLG